MILTFPENFLFGTSTSAYQIETAFDHDWVNVKARDGAIFNRTTEHELRIEQDVAIISATAPNYRMGLMWSKLQRKPFAPFDRQACEHYHKLLVALKNQNVSVMMVLHHFANPIWFVEKGGWERRENIGMFIDFVAKVLKEFGQYVSQWNTFNEPNLYTSMGWVTGEFPPFQKNFFKAYRVLNNLAAAHQLAYETIKKNHSSHPVGISFNCTVFAADNWIGKIPAALTDYCYMEYASSLFKSLDFFGMSYYARIGFDPTPVTFLLTPEKFDRYSREHDDMWEYYPDGLLECMTRFWSKYKKPIIITENGVCTKDDQLRITRLKDYLYRVHKALEQGIEVHGYYHWSTWDNFEWSLGPSYQFGLYGIDIDTNELKKKPSADFYRDVAYNKVMTYEARSRS